jgi:hypothetical protein
MSLKWKRGAFVSTDGIAIGGYDPVAYFIERQAIKGNPNLEVSWSGSGWRFSRASHRDLFLANPEKYAPQCNGLCGFAVSFSDRPNVPEAPPGSPLLWSIKDGKLYLNNNRFAYVLFRLMGLTKRADKVWEKLSG